jgi:hypothetical protein
MPQTSDHAPKVCGQVGRFCTLPTTQEITTENKITTMPVNGTHECQTHENRSGWQDDKEMDGVEKECYVTDVERRWCLLTWNPPTLTGVGH